MKRLFGICLVTLIVTAAPTRAQHSVLVAWTASTSATGNPSLTYNVYRSTSCTGTFALLNGSPVATTNYTDAAVFNGNTYCYQVTAALSGSESSASNQATAVIPAPPASSAAASQAAPAASPKNACTRHGTLVNWLRCVAALPRAEQKK